MSRIVTIDGPAGSGKSTAGKELALQLEYEYFNTGLVYRASGLVVERLGLRVENADECIHILGGISAVVIDNVIETVEVYGQHSFFFTLDTLRTQQASHGASVIGSHDKAGPLLVDLLRASRPDGDFVAEGRNIGSAVFSGANVKFYLTADAAERAMRHYGKVTPQLVDSIMARDHRDESRAFAPLCVPEGLTYIDSTGKNQNEIVELITTECKKRLNLNP